MRINPAGKSTWTSKDEKDLLARLDAFCVDELSQLLKELDLKDWNYQLRTNLFRLREGLIRFNLKSFILCHLRKRGPKEARDLVDHFGSRS
jgi:two-component SAPR family response regulator